MSFINDTIINIIKQQVTYTMTCYINVTTTGIILMYNI